MTAIFYEHNRTQLERRSALNSSPKSKPNGRNYSLFPYRLREYLIIWQSKQSLLTKVNGIFAGSAQYCERRL